MVYFWFSWRQMVLEGRKQAKKKKQTKKKKKSIIFTSTECVIRPHCIFQVVTAYMQDEPDKGSQSYHFVQCQVWLPVYERLPNMVSLRLVTGADCILIWSTWAHCSGRDKSRTPCWAALSQQVCVRVLSDRKLISSCTHVLELCAKSWPGSWSAKQKGKKKSSSRTVYLWDANLLAPYWLVLWPWYRRSSWNGPALMSWKGANC